MVRIISLLIVSSIMVCSGCTSKEQFYRNVSQGVYDSAKQEEEMRDPGNTPPLSDPTPTYEQYMKEREETLQEKKK